MMGYNCPVVQNVLDGRWLVGGRSGSASTRSRRSTRPRATTLPPRGAARYGKGGNRRWDSTRGLRDYLVQVDPANPDLFLGKAYYALGPLRVHSNFFILERLRGGLTDYAERGAVS